MKKYAFRLETVRRVRQAQETVAKSELLRANNEVAAAIAAVEARTARYDIEVDQESGSFGGAVVRVDAFMKRRYFNELAGQAVVAARASLNSARLEAEVRKGLWSETAKKVKALDRLDERRREEYEIEYSRELDAEVDEIVTGRYARTHAVAIEQRRTGS